MYVCRFAYKLCDAIFAVHRSSLCFYSQICEVDDTTLLRNGSTLTCYLRGDMFHIRSRDYYNESDDAWSSWSELCGYDQICHLFRWEVLKRGVGMMPAALASGALFVPHRLHKWWVKSEVTSDSVTILQSKKPLYHIFACSMYILPICAYSVTISFNCAGSCSRCSKIVWPERGQYIYLSPVKQFFKPW